jgi:Phosducin
MLFFSPQFGKVLELADASNFLDAVDNAPPSVTVIVHVYEKVKHCLHKILTI